jgi:alkanesulfonate monooxygenase SsuD/methylene tetrahydromethanopterin reductase-like flavin-dependent oxidoreductase (luciferase family)
MHFGILVMPPHSAVDIGWLAKEAEDRGFESLFFPDCSFPNIRISR